MCTVSVISVPSPPHAGAFRIVCNRDESRDRSPALPPHWRSLLGTHRAIWPIDADAGGTWIGASDVGMVLCLLNLNPCPNAAPAAPKPASAKLPSSKPATPKLVSRGLIIPQLIGAASADEAIDALGRMNLDEFAPFRLVAFEMVRPDFLPRAIEARWDRVAFRAMVHQPGPACFTSSGLGDDLVAPRLELFKQTVLSTPTREAQDRFHRHTWPDHPEISVMMSRAEARTVSVTTVDVAIDAPGRPAVVEMRYREAGDLVSGLRPGARGVWRPNAVAALNAPSQARDA